jgi:hypothetical protein
MPLKIAAEDRKLAVAFAAVLALALVLAIFLVSGGDAGVPSSSFASSNRGAKAAFLLLEQMGYRPQRWTRPPRELASLPSNATLIIADPLTDEGDEREAVRQFVQRGGRVVAAGVTFAPFFPGYAMRPGQPHFERKAYRPAMPSALTRGINEIRMAPSAYFDPDTWPAHFRDGDESPVGRFAYGSGEVVWWSTSEPLSNSAISEAGNAQLLLNSVGSAGRGPVLWDEYFHQGAKTVVDSVLESPLRWALLQCALIGALACFTYSRRFGPVRHSIATSRLAPMEFVETLAALYHKTGVAHVAFEIVYEQFRASLQRRFAVRPSATSDQIAESIAAHLPGEDPNQLSQRLRRIEDAASDPALRAKQATLLIREMHELSRRLKLSKSGGDR